MKPDQELVGSYAPDFELPGTDQQVYHLSRYQKLYKVIAVIFINHQCPIVNQYLERIKNIQAEFLPQGFSFIAINSCDPGEDNRDSLESMQEFAEKHNLSFPYLKDPNQDVAKSFGIRVTPEVFLLDHQSIICYAGSIDDNADTPDLVTHSYLRDSITNLLAGQEIAPTFTEPVGTPIKWRNK